MSFRQLVKISEDRIGVIIGKNGKVKGEIEKKCGVIIDIDSETGDAVISSQSSKDLSEMEPFKAIEIVSAISKGFSPQRAYKLLNEEYSFQLIDLRSYAGKSSNSIQRIKGRIIGEAGKSRKTIEELSGAFISVYGHYVGFIGNSEEIKLAIDAVLLLSSGKTHRMVYNILQEARRRSKIDRIRLWEENTRNNG
ncbi:MAG TPA: KH domain-containing protein [Nitrososphaeraceae archaeon]|jgi:ribosomal RNA assembly protein|nr:KH domain-containing protein [Nitrososphaeraceae archaeon]